MAPLNALHRWPAPPPDLSSLCADTHKDLDPQSPPSWWQVRGSVEAGVQVMNTKEEAMGRIRGRGEKRKAEDSRLEPARV
jgi:hypothetical protein